MKTWLHTTLLLVFCFSCDTWKATTDNSPAIHRWLNQNCKLARFQGKLCDKCCVAEVQRSHWPMFFRIAGFASVQRAWLPSFRSCSWILKDSKQFTILEVFDFCMKLSGQHLGFWVLKELPQFLQNSSHRHCCFSPHFHANLRSVALTDNFDIGRIHESMTIYCFVVGAEWSFWNGPVCKVHAKRFESSK